MLLKDFKVGDSIIISSNLNYYSKFHNLNEFTGFIISINRNNSLPISAIIDGKLIRLLYYDISII